MYGGNTKYHVNPYIQGTTVPCENTMSIPIYRVLLYPVIIQNAKKGQIRIVEKVKETNSDTDMHNRAITVLHA